MGQSANARRCTRCPSRCISKTLSGDSSELVHKGEPDGPAGEDKHSWSSHPDGLNGDLSPPSPLRVSGQLQEDSPARKGAKITEVERGKPGEWVGQGGGDGALSSEPVFFRNLFIRSRSWARCSSDKARFLGADRLSHAARSGLPEYSPGRFLLSCFCRLIMGRPAKSFRLQMASPMNHVRSSRSGSSGQRLALQEGKCLQSSFKSIDTERGERETRGDGEAGEYRTKLRIPTFPFLRVTLSSSHSRRVPVSRLFLVRDLGLSLVFCRPRLDAELLLIKGGERGERRRTCKAGHANDEALQKR